MKIYLTILLIVTSILLQGQSYEVELGVGSGQPYIIEHSDQSIDVDYSLSTNLYSSLIYRNPSAYFDLNLTFLNMNTRIRGVDWRNDQGLNGQVSNFSFLLNLEHISERRFIDLGYSFGIGYTNEIFQPNALLPDFEQKYYSSLNLSGVIRKSLNDRLELLLRPTFLWTDPFDSFDSSNWSVANEDINFLLNVGISYKLKTLANTK